MSQRGPEENGTRLTEAVKQAVLFETGCSEKTCPRWHGSGDLKKCGIESQDEGTASEGGLSGGTVSLQGLYWPNRHLIILQVLLQSFLEYFTLYRVLQIFFSKILHCKYFFPNLPFVYCLCTKADFSPQSLKIMLSHIRLFFF